MCGRYTITTKPADLAARFRIEAPKWSLAARYNAAPTQLLPVILNEPPQRVELLRWGLIPSWAKDPAIGNRMINARAETLAQKPSFRSALKRRRCLILADGFYEWKKTPRGKKPLRITLDPPAPFAMAGLWEEWTDPAGPYDADARQGLKQKLRTFTIITTTANELLSEFHERMPVILRPQDEAVWLAGDTPVDELLKLCRPYPSQGMTAYEVTSRVNSARTDEPSLIEPAG